MRHLVAAIAALVPLTIAATASATTVANVVADVEKVVLEPSAAAPTRIQIHGVFSMAEGGPGKPYGEAKRGYLYFACPAGRDADCKTHFADIQKAIGDARCAGIGQAGEALPKLRASGTTPADPDTYSFGLGVLMSEWHGGACAKTKAVPDETTPPPVDAGTVDSGGPVVADTGSATPPIDAGGSTPPAATPPASGSSGGCSIPASPARGGASVVIILGAAIALVRRRR